ncbi:MAG: hypothetical protein EKK46_09300 [Rhodocyclaceae bacterium]|nr:MAG: hypothetical protein EKK46_09300 [Rhodocyclaceae bacterium]
MEDKKGIESPALSEQRPPMVCFIAFLRVNSDGNYEIDFPDLTGCITVGENLGLVSALAGDQLLNHLTSLMNLGYPVPTPSREEQLADDPRRGCADLMAFEVDLEMLGIANPLTYHPL